MKQTTVKQAEVLKHIKQFLSTNGYPPTIAEIQKLIKRSRSVTHGYMVRLKERGLIEWQPNSARTIKVTEMISERHA